MDSIVMVLASGSPNVSATSNAPMAMPMEPVMSSGLRPHFSTVKIATSVNVMFTTPMITVWVIGLSIPISWKMRGA